MLNRKLTPTFTHVFKDGQHVNIQYTTQYIRDGLYTNELIYVYYKFFDITFMFKSEIDRLPLWLDDAIDEHAHKIWSEKTAEPMQLITERYKTL